MSKNGEVLPFDIANLKGRFTLIVGDVNSGKTHLSRRILEEFLARGEEKITIIDLAPDISEDDIARKPGLLGIGGVLEVPPGHGLSSKVTRIKAGLLPPRLRAKTPQEAIFLAQKNAWIIEELVKEVLAGGVGILFVNDCSMYLQAGDPARISGWIRQAETAVVNGYYGKKLGEGPISEAERKGMEFLMTRCDRLIRI